MTSKICPKCNQITDYDPYFKAYFCKQCGWMENVSKKKRILKLHKPSSYAAVEECKALALCK